MGLLLEDSVNFHIHLSFDSIGLTLHWLGEFNANVRNTPFYLE
jgi:hypothetical protein